MLRLIQIALLCMAKKRLKLNDMHPGILSNMESKKTIKFNQSPISFLDWFVITLVTEHI